MDFRYTFYGVFLLVSARPLCSFFASILFMAGTERAHRMNAEEMHKFTE